MLFKIDNGGKKSITLTISIPYKIKIGVPKTNIPTPAIVWKVERIMINKKNK